jgi:hypothetical protein
MKWTKYLLSLNILIIISCKESKKTNHLTPNETYLMDKFGAPSEDLIQQHYKLVHSILQHKNRRSNNSAITGSWTQQGPGNIGGRITALAVHPTNQNIIYLGFPNGGVFKTTNGGISWNPILMIR